MAHDTPTLTANPRDRTGTRYARRLRQTGQLPAVIYGHKKDPVSISVDEKQAILLLSQGAHLVTLDVKDGKSETCLVKDLQFGYLGDNVVHIDFSRVDLDEEVTVNVHLNFTGEPESAKKPGAILTTDIADLEIICKASEIPGEIRVDISEMDQSLTVGELTLPPNVRTDVDPETPVVHITIIAEEAEGEEVEVTGEAEPEVITETKDEEEPKKEEGGDK